MGGKGSRPESIPRSDTEIQDPANTLPKDTHTEVSNGKDTNISESKFWLVGLKHLSLKLEKKKNNQLCGLELTNT